MSKTRDPKAIKIAFRDYLNQFYKQKINSAIGLFLPGIGVILVFYVPTLVIAALIEEFTNKSIELDQALPYLLAFAAIWLLGEILFRVAVFYQNIVIKNGMKQLYIQGFDRLLHRDIGFFHDNFSGSLTKKLTGYAKNFDMFMTTLSFNVFANVLPLIFAGIILWRFSPWLVLFLYLSLLMVLAIIIPLIRKRQKLVDEREKSSNIMTGHIADAIGNIDTVLAFAQENHEEKNHRRFVNDFVVKSRLSWDYHNTKIDSAISPLYVLINVIGLAVAISLGSSVLNIASVFVVFNYFAYSTRILFEFNRLYRNLESSITDAAQFTELFLDQPNIKSANSTRKLIVQKGSIEFKEVSFKYEDGNLELFNSFNLRIEPGEKVALVGHSGSGKTTITKLLLRFKEIDSGEVLIDNQDVSGVSLKSLRDSIAYVPQEPAMFHRTIADNIKYGKLTASEAEVISAAKKANAHQFIEELANGYDTLVGERGVKLSGGQRQRIAIARAIIKNAPIILLDEATSALDSHSEGLIQQALWQLMENRTAIVIAHRLSTIQKMDRIIVLDNGQIAEQGSHSQLLQIKDGIYASLWRHQSGGFIED